MTSHDVVQQVRRIYGERSIGHLGTLDPFATGLLVLLLGRATRLATFLDIEPKVYEATITFGTETDTDDSTGRVVRSAALPSESEIRSGLASLTGNIAQIPPAYSAKSVEGTRAYDAARRGAPLDLPPVEVTVRSWEVRDVGAEALRATVTCSGGTYSRALARDLGRLTSSAAHLSALRRLRVGSFDVRHASKLEDLRESRIRPRTLHVVTDA
jgi:tRNA pseudouridine55 synthase